MKLLSITILSFAIAWYFFIQCAMGQDAKGPTAEKVRVALAGDSTVTDQAGWGAEFGQLLKPEAECRNFARGGQSSKSFLNQKIWDAVLNWKPQYILIQFGHNDMPGKGPQRETDPQTTYAANLARYVDEARAAGAIPILVTPLVRRIFNSDGKLRMELAPWADAMRKVAKDKQVPLVDLNARSAELVEKLGPEKSNEFNPESKEPGTTDRTHLSKRGAEVFARVIADDLKQAEPNLAKLLK